MPTGITPMLATLTDKPFDDPGWRYEIKWDGYRALAFMNKRKVDIRSRNNKSFNERFYPVYDALKRLNLRAVLDGEIVVAGKEGVSDFGDLQNWRSGADGDLRFYVFDILWLNGYSTMQLPLSDRQKLLADLLQQHPPIYISRVFDAGGIAFFEAAKKAKLEGIMAKKTDSLYTPGIRTKEWLKIKFAKRHEVVIGGFTKNEGSSKAFSALLVGVYKGKKLLYTGKIGTGFPNSLQKEMMGQFKKLVRKNSPFDILPEVNKPSRFRPNPPGVKVTWLEPKLVCEVSYTEITSDGLMRHPSFEGMRIDKKAKDVKEEKTTSSKSIIAGDMLHRKKMLSPTKKTSATVSIHSQKRFNGS